MNEVFTSKETLMLHQSGSDTQKIWYQMSYNDQITIIKNSTKLTYFDEELLNTCEVFFLNCCMISSNISHSSNLTPWSFYSDIYWVLH